MAVRLSVVLVAAAIALPARTVEAQGGGQGAPLQNLQEFSPNSVNIDFEIATLENASGNTDAAIMRLRAILARNPNDRRAQQALQRLGVQP